ncbi:glycerol dehydrogenase [Shinella sp.]|uniref:glycerol dehydrogenase n=1 Tax=Shinella sp. TaxID=1870904 RepID=UPI003F6F066F
MNSPLTIFDADLKVFGAPRRYVQGRGILTRIGDFAAQIGQSAVLVADVHILPLVEQTIRRSCEQRDVSLTVLPFEGRLGPETGHHLAARLGDDGAPAIVLAAGGGRAIDAGKALADTRGLRLITIPTVASNDAPTSKNYVLYDENDVLLDVRHLARNPDFVVVDTVLLAGAPKAMFAAGLGDALSKKAEALACAAGSGLTMFRARPTRLAGTIATACYDTLMTHGRAAYDAAGTGAPTEAFEAAVEAMILMAGLGFESGGLSVPHALTRGLPLLPGVKTRPHGLQVAYGLVVHHRLMGEAMPDALLALYHHAGLPLCLADLTAAQISRSQLTAVAQASIAVPHMLNFSKTLTVADLVDAMLAIEAEATVRPAIANRRGR